MLWFWTFYLLTTLISREKLSKKKNLVKNSWKCWGFVKIEFLDKNLTFRIVWLTSYDQNGQWQNLTSMSNVRKLRDLQKPKSKWVPRREWRRWQIKTRCTFAAHLTRCGALSFHSISLSRRCKVFDTWAVTIFHRIQRNGFFSFLTKVKNWQNCANKIF